MTAMADALSYSVASFRIPPPPPPQTPLRSPKRRQQLSTDEQDPLLAGLSPEAILDALASINAVPKHEPRAKDILVRSMSQVSPDDRVIGARAALAAQKLKTWLRELSAWQWPTGKDMHRGKGFLPPTADPSRDGQVFCGSLSAQTVTQYETYIEEIKSRIDNLRIEELKEHIINVHVPGRSRPSSANSAMSSISAPPFTYTQLSDFATVITATILRALPTLSRLNRLLSTWTVRLLVSRQIPGLLESIEAARKLLDVALSTLHTIGHNDDFSTSTVHAKKEELKQYISTAGLRMDTILDALETCEDSLPDSWIDQMDALEADFVTWAQRAQQIAFEREWKRSEAREEHHSSKEAEAPALENVGPFSENSGDNEPKPVSPGSSLQNNLVNMPTETSATIPKDAEPTNDDTLPAPNDPRVPSESTTGPTVENTSGISQTHSQTQLDSYVTTDDTSVQSLSTITPDTCVNAIPTPNIDGPTPCEDTPSDTPFKDQLFQNSEVSAQPECSVNDTSVSEAQSKPAPSTGATSGDIITDLNTSEEEDIKQATQPPSPGTPGIHLPSPSKPDSPPLSSSESHPVEVPINVDPEAINLAPEKDSDIPSDPVISGREKGLNTIYEVPLEPQDSPSIQHADIYNISDTEGDKSVASEDTTTFIETDIPTPDSPVDTSTPQHLQSSSPHPIIAVSKATGEVAEEGTEGSHDGNNSRLSANIDDTSSPSLVESDSERGLPLDRDEPIQSIEYPYEGQLLDNNTFHNQHNHFTPTKSPSVAVETPDLTILSSPGVVSNDSDRTLRDRFSPKLDDSLLQKLQIFKHNDNASLPLQRFINDETDTSFSVVEGSYRQNNFSTPRRSSDSLGSLQKNANLTSSRKDSESPPPDALPRRAVRGPSSSLMRGTISSLNKAVGNTPRHESDSISADMGSNRLHPRYRAVSTKDIDPDSVSLNRKASNNSLLSAPSAFVHSKPSMESIGSYASSTEYAERRRKYSFSDGGSFAMRPVNEADDELQEKIHSILTGIPGQIRLSNNPASDFDQRSVVSSVSTSIRNQFGSRSPFSTPSRVSTPTPSGTFTPTSRPKRTTSYKTEDKTVRVYHLHHRGKAQPTKLFVRTVGEDGERVMVRVGGGWADLREYLREYVIHHSRQTPSKSQVEVKGLPISTSPGSTATLSADNTPSVPRPSSVISNRPGSSLSVRKTRRPSKPAADLPALTAENIDIAGEELTFPSFPSARRGSASSINSVSMSSILGDGSSVYSPHPGSARTPHTQSSTPLGLAGPKPRTRHVSMTPESEAWMENVIGQARRTSSSVKPIQKPTDPRIDRELHNSSKMSVRSVSDIGSIGRNKRVLLKGLGAHEQS
ncbi:uncharacterized protein TRUGW13939_04225 [Talaromyces rugulosus]|uniref:GAR domain-containing protein n=1 Tax=Talaromyces rugulosus TaxID=121627 RepID=A0A7H8QSZ7_TALRU|nr:uncharacterized protein TRUGW13939_04225 [Talaromyces rugulosus]QKX57117.1 hypothetical protein TRUGW13939_04225 [Talaromyces rugulosus]